MAETKKFLNRSMRYNIFFGALIVILILANVAIALEWFSLPRTLLWIMNMVLITLFIVIAGKGITGQWPGFLIDDRLNRISLSRFQLVLWTIVILPALLTVVIFNIPNASDAPPDSPVKDDPLNVQVPPEVWGLLGISVVSLASSEYIKDQNVDQDVLQQKLDEQEAAESPQEIAVDPSLPAPNSDPAQARFVDMFRGETESSKGFLEIGKVQMFFFTLVVALAYATAVGDVLRDTELQVIEGLPGLTAGMVALLGISQGGYIANKAISYNSTPSTSGTTESGVEPSITGFGPDPIDFDNAESLVITGKNFDQDPNTPPKGTVFLDGRSLTTESWTPELIKARLPENKEVATAEGFILRSSVELVVQHYSGRRSPPAPKKVSLI
jgi:hypothetical protein